MTDDTTVTSTKAASVLEPMAHAHEHQHEHDNCCGHDHHHGHHHHHHAPVVTYQRSAPKVGRNDPCPCGSGKKHKKCCLAA